MAIPPMAVAGMTPTPPRETSPSAVERLQIAREWLVALAAEAEACEALSEREKSQLERLGYLSTDRRGWSRACRNPIELETEYTLLLARQLAGRLRGAPVLRLHLNGDSP